ncbi:MAG: carboxypeptidase regulatory-like domain-containing protein [Candidatus Sulfotelmatobacter sp.]
MVPFTGIDHSGALTWQARMSYGTVKARQRATLGLLLCAFAFAAILPAFTQTTPAKIGQLDLTVGGLSATVTPAQPVIPKNISSGVQIVVTLNGQTLTSSAVAQYLGGSFQIQGEYSGPGLSQTVDVPQSPAVNSLVLNLPAVNEAGNYTLSNLRFMVNGNDVFDLSPNSVIVNVIDQVLVTSVQTQALTLDQIEAMGVVLNSSDYTGFQFTIGLQLSSQVVNISFPVVFDPQGVPVPQPISPPSAPTPQGVNVPVTIVPILLQAGNGNGGGSSPLPPLPGGGQISIPSVLVIPGNVGYLKQFFSAQLYVTNNTPAEANLVVDNIAGTINLPPGPSGVVGGSDEPLGLPTLVSGPEATTMPILLNGASTLNAGQTGQAGWTIVANSEGFYTVNFGINATLEGLPTGPVNLTGNAMGGLLVRNPYFNMTFTVPAVVRSQEQFNVYATVTNISQAIANNLTVAIDAASLSGVELTSGPMSPIPTLNPGDSTTLTYQFKALVTGQVVADYLHFDTQNGTTGQLNFTLGVYANGTPMSPDTIVLPSSVDNLPSDIVNAAMRVLGQAWSVATAPPGTLPASVIPTTTAVVTTKALNLSEAGLRQTLGEPLPNALRDLAPDWWGGSPVDPGFNQVLQTTPAGQNFIAVLGADLAPPMVQAGGSVPYELQLAQLEASGPNFLSFAVGQGTGASPVAVSLTDSVGNQLSTNTVGGGNIPGGVLLFLGTTSPAPMLGLVTAPTAPPYTLLITPQSSGFTDLSISIPSGTGTVVRGQIGVTTVQGQAMRVIADFTNPNNLVLQVDTNGDGSFATSIPLSTQIISPSGPNLTSATVIGPDTVSQAGPFGLNMVLLFDRIVDATTSAVTANYTIPNNSVQSASRQLSGRLVFGNLTQPEGPYVPTTVAVGGVEDQRGVVGPSNTVNLQSTLVDPGAVVSGSVLNANGSTSTSATVTYLNSPYSVPCGSSGSGMVGLASTPLSSSGLYQFRYVRQDNCGGPFAVATNDPTTGELRQVASYVRGPGQQIVINLAMLGQGSVTGQVTDLSGNPVPNAQVVAVSATDIQGGSNPQVGGQAYTDGNGNYTITGITVGPFTVKAGLGADLGASAGNIERAGTTAVVNVTLNSGAVNVSGVVTQIQNGVTTPIPGLPVAYYQFNGANRYAVAYVLTAADGSYTLTAMPTGAYTVEATLGVSGEIADDSGVAAAGNNIVANLSIVIPTTAVVDGIVTYANGSPYAGALVYQGQYGTLSNPDGTFSLSGIPVLPSQSQTIFARTLDGLRTGQTTVVVNSAAQPITGASITLSGIGTVQFTVLDPNGNPVSGQQVNIPAGSAPACSNYCGCNMQTTNASGVVTFTGIPLGSVTGSAINSASDLAQAKANVTQDGVTAFGVMQFHGSGTVTGSVVDPSNNPVLGATVQLSSNTVSQYCTLQQVYTQSAQTGANGKFQFNDVLLGSVGVTASQSFYPTQVGAQGSLTTNGGTANFTLQMVNTIAGVLSGVVYLPDGVTPAGAGVQVTANGPLPNITVSTDPTGTFTFAKIFPQGMYTLSAADPVSGGVTQMQVYLIAGQNATQNLRLLGTGTINVTVVDGAGVPVASAFVTLNENNYPNAVFNGSLGASNQGVISFPDVFEGPFSVSVVDPFGRSGRASGVLPQGTSSVNIQVQETTTGTVQGTYYLPDGVTPIPNAIVNLTASGRVIGQATTAGTGNVGSYSFDYVPAGSVQLNAQDPLSGRTGIAAGSITTQGQVLTLNVIAEGLDTIQGLVTSDGSPQPGASVSITSGSFQATTSANSSGIYLMSGVPEGVVVATASLSNGFLTGTASTSVSGDGNTVTLNVALRTSGSVTGQVLQAGGTTPATASLVTINVGGTGGGTLSTTTDAQGNFSFNLVPAGTATISVQVLGSIDQGTGMVIVPAGSSVTTTVTLNGIGSLSGVALDSSGQPTPGTIILRGTGQFPYYLTVTAAANGTFALPQVLAGPFTAQLSANIGGFTLYGTASGTVSPNQNDNLSIEVQPSGTITGIVLRPDGQTPAVGANVVVQLTTGANITLQAQNDGSFNAVGVPLGAFTVQITDPISGGIAAILGQSIATNDQIVNLGTITLDGSALSIVSSNPVSGATGVAINQPLTVTFSEALASTNGIYVTNGTTNLYLSSSLSADGKTVTLQGTLPDGIPLNLNVTGLVTDIFGRQLPLPQVITFTTVDLTPPYVTSIAPANQAIQVPVNSSIVVTFDKALSASAPIGSVIALSSVGGAVNGTATLSAPNALTFTPSVPLLNNTIYTVTVNGATSFGGNVQTSAFTSTFDSPETTMPVLQLSSPLNGAYVNTATPTITIQLTDQLTGINPATATMTIDGVAVTPNVGSTSMTFTPSTALSSGTHTIAASVANNAGVVGMFSGSFIVDTTPPSVATLNGITAGQTLAGQITISSSATDSISGIAKVNFLVDNAVQASLLPPNFTTVFNTAILPDGPHNFAAQAVNNAGTNGPASVAISANVENVPLSVTIASPMNNAYFKGQVTVTATASEPVQQIAFSLGSQSYAATASPYQATFSLSGAPDGPTVITATATDFAGATASSTVTINVKQMAPPAPNGNVIFAEPPSNGYSLVYGAAGAVNAGGLTINIVDTVTQATATATSAVDGSFATSIAAAVNDTLSFTTTDQVGNVSAATLITVRSTKSLPPSSGNTSLVYQGDVADLVGGGSNGLTPGPTNNAVFTLSLNIGQGVTRTISSITLSGPQSFSTNSSNLGVAADVGGPLLNGTNGTVNFPVTTGATLTLFAVDNGFIQAGDTYTATAVFSDGSQFVAEYIYVAPANRQYVAHSATITANPATVIVTGSTASTSIITITNIKDIDGNVVPDGANIALSAANMATVNPAGTPVPSAGGAFIDGATAANNPNFQVYTIRNGAVTATYSTQSVTPSPITGTMAVIQMQASDANGNVLGTRVVSSQDINIRASTDTAIVSVSPGSLYADRGNHTSQVTVVLRDANGHLLPDGTQAAITVQGNSAVVNGCCYLASAGGTLTGLAASPNGSSFGLGTMSGGQITFQYTDSGIYQGTNGISPAAIAVLPVNSSGGITTNNAIGTADITLVGAAIADINPAQPSVPQVSPAEPLQVFVQDVHDARGNLVPDGSNIGVTASANQSITGGCCYVNSAGGTILDGTPVSNNMNWHYYPLVSNGFVSTYSTDGSTNVNPGQTGTATLQLVMVDPNANVLDINVISTQNIILVPPSNAIGSALPSSVLGDGGIHTSTVTFSPVIDAFGNTIPDGTQLAATATADAAITGGGCCYVNSAGGQIVSGTPASNNANYKIHTVQNGAVTVTYADQNVTATPGQELTANVSLLEVNSSGQVTNNNEIGIVPVTIAGLTTARGVASPTSVFANGGDYRSTITLSNFRDAAGNPVPDGTQVAVTAANDVAITGGGCCYVNSAGGAIIGGTISSFSSVYSIFTVTNGQVVFQYSSQGVSVASGSQTATVAVIPVTPNGSEISNYAIATVSIQLLAPGSANVSFSPVDLTANGNANQSAVTISGLLESDGVTPIPNGALVGLTAVPNAAITSNGCCYIGGSGGTLASAGTSPGDGTLATNNSNFEQFTVAGGQVLVSYSDLGITANVGQTIQSYVSVVPLSSNGAVLTADAVGVGTINLHGITSATGNGPSTLAGNATASVTFGGIKDSAGNTVPDGTAVAVTAGNNVAVTPNGCCYVSSTGGTIVNGTTSSTNSNFKVFTTVGGSITVTYSSAGASVGTASVQIVPATSSGALLSGSLPTTLNGGVWNITITN